MTKGTDRKLESKKEIAGNPIMQDYTKGPDGKMIHRSYSKPPDFNYGFIP